jgi:hypothetical protein
LTTGNNTDVHYTSAHVSIKTERAKTKYWSKSSTAHEVDQAFDRAFDSAFEKFGDLTTWHLRRRAVVNFFKKKMAPYLGVEFTLTQKNLVYPTGPRKIINPGEGAHGATIQCHTTRAAKIEAILARHRESTVQA